MISCTPAKECLEFSRYFSGKASPGVHDSAPIYMAVSLVIRKSANNANYLA